MVDVEVLKKAKGNRVSIDFYPFEGVTTVYLADVDKVRILKKTQ